MNKELASIFKTPFTSLMHEGMLARQLVWKHGKALIFFAIWDKVQNLILKIVKIALVGAVFSTFQEPTILEFLKTHWVHALIILGVWGILTKYLDAHESFIREKTEKVLNLEIKKMIWNKTQSIGIGTRLSSQFRQRLRGAKRCNSWDIKSVSLWPIEVVAALVTSIIFFLGLAWLSWKMSALFMGTALIIAVSTSWLSRWARKKEREMEEDEDKASEYHPASLSIDSTLLGTSSFLFNRSVSLYTSLLVRQLAFMKQAMKTGTLVGGLVFIAIGIELYLLRDVIFKEMTFARLGLTISTMAMAVGTFVETTRTFFSEQGSVQDVSELKNFLEYKDEEAQRIDTSFGMTEHDSVIVDSIDFSYPYLDNAPTVIQDITLKFNPGEAVVIVGSNGSGKTTLGKIIANVYRPTRGVTKYGAQVVSEHTTRCCLEHIVMIPQTGDLPEIKLCESLFGRTELESLSIVDTSRYFEAIKLSGAKDVLDDLPDNIHTQIGTAFKGGTNLSGGQEQRLRLAAFFYKALDPNIRMVIADEPSRYLDPNIRERVYNSLISMARDKGKIVIVISHDAELEKFDRVIVLQRGRVVGDHRGDEEIQKAVRTVSRQLAADTVKDRE